MSLMDSIRRLFDYPEEEEYEEEEEFLAHEGTSNTGVTVQPGTKFQKKQGCKYPCDNSAGSGTGKTRTV